MTITKIIRIIFVLIFTVVCLNFAYQYYWETNEVKRIPLSEHYILHKNEDYDGTITWSITNNYLRIVVPSVKEYAIHNHYVIGQTDSDGFFILDTNLDVKFVETFGNKADFEEKLASFEINFGSLTFKNTEGLDPY